MRALLVAAVALFACVAPLFAQNKADARVTTLVESLGSSDVRVRNDAYATLLREKPPAALPILLDVLPRLDVYGQGLGLTLLQPNPQESGHPILRKLLDKKAPLLELGAAVQFVRAGESDLVDHVVKPLAKEGVTSEMRCAMLTRLYGLKEPRVPEAVRALLVPSAPPDVVVEALYPLLNIDDSGSPGFADLRRRNTDALVAGSLTKLVDGRFDGRYKLWDVVKGVDQGGQSMAVQAGDLRLAAHRDVTRSVEPRDLIRTHSLLRGSNLAQQDWRGIRSVTRAERDLAHLRNSLAACLRELDDDGVLEPLLLIVAGD